MHIPSYSSIFALGHKAISALTTVPVIVEEKVDGSQFSFAVLEGEVCARSKGADLHLDAPEKMFTKGVETLRELAPNLRPGWIYRGEFLAKPKHNALAYSRAPEKNVIIFDIDDGRGTFLSYEEKKAEATRVGLETVPLLFSGMLDPSILQDLLQTVSILGGQKIEGLVVKPADYSLFGPDKKVLMGKFVSEAFKEVHAGEWRKANPTSSDIIQQLVLTYRTPARWAKAVQHLREAGTLEGSLRDIGALIKEVARDVEKEEQAEIRDRLYKWAWDHIRRGIVAGLPEWYKGELLLEQFRTEEEK